MGSPSFSLIRRLSLAGLAMIVLATACTSAGAASTWVESADRACADLLAQRDPLALERTSIRDHQHILRRLHAELDSLSRPGDRAGDTVDGLLAILATAVDAHDPLVKALVNEDVRGQQVAMLELTGSLALFSYQAGSIGLVACADDVFNLGGTGEGLEPAAEGYALGLLDGYGWTVEEAVCAVESADGIDVSLGDVLRYGPGAPLPQRTAVDAANAWSDAASACNISLDLRLTLLDLSPIVAGSAGPLFLEQPDGMTIEEALRALADAGLTKIAGVPPLENVPEEVTAAVSRSDEIATDGLEAEGGLDHLGFNVDEGDGFTEVTIPDSLLFDFDSATVKPDSRQAIDQIAAFFVDRYVSATIEVIGHTDSVGDETYNLDLSQRRADSVASLLATAPGFDKFTVSAVGRGESDPVADNGTTEGRKQNRRVVVLATDTG